MMKKALIVDDSRLACKVMANMLSSMEIMSSAVYSAEDALDYLQSHKPDVIFLDHTMPGISGLELIKLIKYNPQLNKIPVLMYTAKEGKLYAERAKELGAVDVLPKGLEKKSLSNVLSKIGLLPNELNKPESTSKSESTTKPKEPVPTSATSHNNVHSDSQAVKERPVWQSFWLQKAEPYLNRHKLYCVDEVQRNTKLQTRQLKREFHQTLESFEHAIFHRMQSHNEFVEAQEQLTKQFYRKILVGLCIFASFLLAIVFWQLWQINHQTNSIITAQNNTTLKQLKIEEQLIQVAKNMSSLEQLSPQETSNQTLEYSGVALLDEEGELISELTPVDNSSDLYTGKTSTNYKFAVNSQGELGLPMKTRYYLTDNCDGDIFVDSPSGSILRDPYNNIWYVDILASAMMLTVNSKLTENDNCVSVNGELLNLHRLLRNQSIVTGVNDQQLTELYFNR